MLSYAVSNTTKNAPRNNRASMLGWANVMRLTFLFFFLSVFLDYPNLQ